MPLYNISNLTSTNIYQAAFSINQLEPIFGPILLVIPFFLMIFGLLAAGYNMKSALVASSFVCSLAGLILRATGLIGDGVLITFILLSAGSAAFMYVTQRGD